MVYGVSDNNIRKKMLEDKELPLDKCIQIARAPETSRHQSEVMVGSTASGETSQVDQVQSRQQGSLQPKSKR